MEPHLLFRKSSTEMESGTGAALARLTVAQAHPIRFTRSNYSKRAAVVTPGSIHRHPPFSVVAAVWPIPSAAIEPLRTAVVSAPMKWRIQDVLWASCNDAHKAFVQFPLIIEDRLADPIHRPNALRVIRVINEPTCKHLIAVPRRIKKVDRLASRDAMSGWADVERNVIASNDVSRLANLRPRIQ